MSVSSLRGISQGHLMAEDLLLVGDLFPLIELRSDYQIR